MPERRPRSITDSDIASAVAVAVDFGEDTASRAGDLALRIADIAVSQSKLGLLTHELATLLTSEMDADATAFFWCRPQHRRAHAPRPSLQSVAAVSPAGGLSAEMLRRHKASGYRALSRAQLIARAAAAETGQGDAQRLTIALPLGTGSPWAVCTLSWGAISPARSAAYAELLRRLTPALVTALRPAHTLDEAMQQEPAHSPRRTVFAVTSEAILTVDEDLTIRETNPAFTKILGWPEHVVVGKRCSSVLRCRDDRKMLLCDTPRCPLQEALRSETAAPIRDLSWETRTGKLCEVSASFTAQGSRQGRSPVATPPSGFPPGPAAGGSPAQPAGPGGMGGQAQPGWPEADARAVIVARDVTLLNAANRMRANFISMVSHELRTPLNSINGFLEIVLESPVGPLNERQREFLNYARVSTQQLTTLVEDILFISKADSGQFTLRLEQVDVRKLAAQAVQALQAAADKAQVTLAVQVAPALPRLHADGLRLQQVLSNLLGNAIKFSPPESQVLLTVAGLEDGGFTFSVADQGRGVPLEDHARIFERFYQSDSSVRNRSGGYGLGLSIAKLIVEQHNGRIWVESAPGEGATFSFTIPPHVRKS